MSWQQPGGSGFNPNAAGWTPPGAAGRGGGYPATGFGGLGQPGMQGYQQPGMYGAFPGQQQPGMPGAYQQAGGYQQPGFPMGQFQHPGMYVPQQQPGMPGAYQQAGGYPQPGMYAPPVQAGVAPMVGGRAVPGAPFVPGAQRAPPVAAPVADPIPPSAESKLQLGGAKKKDDFVMPKKAAGAKGKVFSLSDPEPKKAEPAAPSGSAAPPTAPPPPSTGSATALPTEEASAEPPAATTPVTAAPAPKPKKAQKEYVRDPRPHFNVVFCGHVDAGKSTVSGHLLADHGIVDQREMDKLRREAEVNHREGWEYAYVMDVSEEERERGKTHETGSAYFTTPHRRLTILDAPGHKAFVPSMIGGATQADLAVMVVSSRTGEFETGFEKGGQTREHTTLLRTCGIKHLICVVNKMDDIGWDKARYDEIVSKTQPWFKQNGYDERNKSLIYIPISALKGFGLSTPPPPICDWYSGPSLLDHINNLVLPQSRSDTDELCIPIAGSYRDDGKLFIYGKVESGSIVPGDDVQLLPTKQRIVVEAVQVEAGEIEKAYVGDTVHVRIRGVEEAELHPGFVLTSVPTSLKAVEFFQARIVVLEVKNILSAGSKMMMHMHAATEEVSIHKLLGKLDKRTLEPTEKDPACARAGEMVLARLQLEHPLTMEVHKDFDKLGRFILRDDGRTIAIGLVTKLYDSTKESLARQGKE